MRSGHKSKWPVLNENRAEELTSARQQLPMEGRYGLGATPDNTPALRAESGLPNRQLLATRGSRHPHQDDDVEVRRIFHKLRSLAIELFLGLFKTIFEWRGQMLVKGLNKCQLLVL